MFGSLNHGRVFARRAVQRLTIAAIAVTLVGAGIGVGAVGPSSAAPILTAAQSPIVVGNVSALSGPVGEGVGLQAALKAWADSVNASGGIHGHPVKLVLMDDQGDPVQALTDVRELVNQDHAVALVGNFDQVAESSYVSVLNQAGIPDIGGWVGNDPFWADNPSFYPVIITGTPVVDANVVAAKYVGATTVGVPYCLESPQCAQVAPVLKTATKKAGLKWASAVGVSSSQPTYTAACLQLQGGHADALVDAIFDPARFLEGCAQQNYKPKFVVTISGVLATPFEGSSKWDGQLVGVSPNYPWTVKNSKTAAFRAAMAKYAPRVSYGPDAMLAWTAGLMFQIAADAVPGTVTPASLTHSLRQIKDETLGGLAAQPISYTNSTSHALDCFYVMQFAKSNWTAPQNPKPLCAASS
jgi:branched-chain amino acid transport system substrate-binding protein